MKICCDIDGCLADVRKFALQYLPHDWKTYFEHTREFPPIVPVAELLHRFHQHHEVYIVTGRPESNRNETIMWFHRQLPLYDILSPDLLMRQDGDPRPTPEIKLVWYQQLLPDLIIDDDPEVIKIATTAGFTIMQIHGFRLPTPDVIPENYI